MNRPPSFGQHCRMGKSSSEKSPFLMTSLQGPVETVFGKNLPTSVNMGSILSLSMKPCGDFRSMNILMRAGISSRESTSSASFMRSAEPNWLISTLAPGCPLTFSNSNAGPPGPMLAARPPFRDTIGDLGDLQDGIDFCFDPLQLSGFVERGDPFPQVAICHRPAFLQRRDAAALACALHCRYVLYKHRIISQLQTPIKLAAVGHWREAAIS